MKLVQLLAKELKEWPEDDEGSDPILFITQDASGEIFSWNDNGELKFADGRWYMQGTIPFDELIFDGSETCSDCSYEIVREDQWYYEREKMNNPKWIRHRGGKCPVPCGTKVETRHRDGNTCSPHFHTQNSRSEVAANAVWKHQGDRMDIMAYRIIEQTKDQEIEEVKVADVNLEMMQGDSWVTIDSVSSDFVASVFVVDPPPKGEEVKDTNIGTLTYKLEVDTSSAMTALNELSAKWDQLESPLKWRDEIIELEAYEEEFRREREKLIRKLESEGFKLIDHMAPIYGEQIIDMSDWRNWQVGDVFVTDGRCQYYTKGKEYGAKPCK